MNQQISLDDLVRKHVHLGVLWGSHFILPCVIALPFLDELEVAAIPVHGITAWIYVVLQDGTISFGEELAYFFNIQASVFDTEKAVRDSIRLAKEHITQIMK